MCNNGSGWAGWDDEEKIYLRCDSTTSENEHCMKVISIEPRTRSKCSTKGVCKKYTKVEKLDQKQVSSDTEKEISTCMFILTKG